jgi:hypothetical protein
MRTSRRVFLAQGAACGAAIGLGAGAGSAAGTREIAVGYAGPEGSLARGVTLGVEEAQRTASLLGRSVSLHGPASARARVVGWVAGDANDGSLAVRSPVLLTADDETSERSFRVASTLAIRIARLGLELHRRGRRRWRLAVPDADGVAVRDQVRSHMGGLDAIEVAAGEDVVVWCSRAAPPASLAEGKTMVAGIGEPGQLPEDVKALWTTDWHASLQPYGAAQLNDRYRARFRDEAMSAPAWRGWFAVKALVESSLAARDPASTDVRDHLHSGAWDGHKGEPLRFDAHGDLQQPVYVIEARAGQWTLVRDDGTGPA